MDALPVGWMLVVLATIGIIVVWTFAQVMSGVLQRLGEMLANWMFGGDTDRDE